MSNSCIEVTVKSREKFHVTQNDIRKRLPPWIKLYKLKRSQEKQRRKLEAW